MVGNKPRNTSLLFATGDESRNASNFEGIPRFNHVWVCGIFNRGSWWIDAFIYEDVQVEVAALAGNVVR